MKDKKLKGQLQHNEALSKQAAQQAAKAEEWLLPSEAGALETEGMERSYRLSQVLLASSIFQYTLVLFAACLELWRYGNVFVVVCSCYHKAKVTEEHIDELGRAWHIDEPGQGYQTTARAHYACHCQLWLCI